MKNEWVWKVLIKLFEWYVKIGDYFEVGWWKDYK